MIENLRYDFENRYKKIREPPMKAPTGGQARNVRFSYLFVFICGGAFFSFQLTLLRRNLKRYTINGNRRVD